MKCPCAHDKPEPFHRESWQRKWNAAFDKLPKHLQDEILRDPTGDAAHNFNQLLMKRNPVKRRKKMGSPWRFVKGAKPGFRKLKNIRTGKVRLIKMGARKASRRHRGNPKRETLFISRTITGDTFLVKDARGSLVGRFNSLEEAQRWIIENGYRMTYRNPVTVRKLGSGAYRVRGERRKIHAFGTTKARATRQARLIRAVEHGWKPTGQPALAVRKKLKAMRKPARVGHRLFAHRNGRHWTLRTAPRGGLVIAKHLTLEQLRSRARKLSYKIRSL